MSGCDRPHYAKGCCTRHYQLQRSLAGGAKPNRSNGATLVRDKSGRKQCVACLLWLDEADFASHRKTLDRLQVRCRACGNVARKFTQYGLSTDRIAEIMREQKHRCAICRADISGRYVVDHDHSCCHGIRSCGICIRGFLCDGCNLGLGSFQDSVEFLRSAIRYLSR